MNWEDRREAGAMGRTDTQLGRRKNEGRKSGRKPRSKIVTLWGLLCWMVNCFKLWWGPRQSHGCRLILTSSGGRKDCILHCTILNIFLPASVFRDHLLISTSLLRFTSHTVTWCPWVPHSTRQRRGHLKVVKTVSPGFAGTNHMELKLLWHQTPLRAAHAGRWYHDRTAHNMPYDRMYIMIHSYRFSLTWWWLDPAPQSRQHWL